MILDSSSENYCFIKCILKDSVQNAKTWKIEKMYDHDVNSYCAILSEEIGNITFRRISQITIFRSLICNRSHSLLLGRGLLAKIISLRGTHVGNIWFGFI